jgi:hypothetical protein
MIAYCYSEEWIEGVYFGESEIPGVLLIIELFP